MTHKVRSYHWSKNILTFFDKLFDNLEDALYYAEHEALGETIKVYNELDQLVQQFDRSKSKSNITYA